MIRKILFLLLTCCFTLSSFAQTSAKHQNRPSGWDSIKHVVIIILENTGADEALQQPFMKSLTTKGAYLDQYYAITHPSQPNYFALVAGSTFGADNTNVTLDALHIGDLIDARGKTWKTYAENYPGNCYLGSTSGDYARRHEPFISFRTVQSNPDQCKKIVSGTEFFTDLANNNLPTYSFYVPNNKNNGHDTGAPYADQWLSNTFGNILNDPNILKDTLFVITFDEDSGNHIYTVFLGPGVKVGYKSTVQYTHYSMLRTIEEIFNLGSMCMNDQTAQVISDVWLA